MLSTLRDLTILLFALPILLFLRNVSGQAVSLSKAPDLRKQRDCVQSCVVGSTYANVVHAVGCGLSNEHACLCREDLRSLASDYLAGCLPKQHPPCTGSEDSVAAASIFDRYCGFTAPAAASASPTPSEDAGASSAVTVSTTATSGPTMTAQPSTSSSTPAPAVGELLLLAASISLLCLHR